MGVEFVFQKKRSEELKEALLNFKRQALHSKKLTLNHPISGELMVMESTTSR